jgi:hypothetical protein
MSKAGYSIVKERASSHVPAQLQVGGDEAAIEPDDFAICVEIANLKSQISDSAVARFRGGSRSAARVCTGTPTFCVRRGGRLSLFG